MKLNFFKFVKFEERESLLTVYCFAFANLFISSLPFPVEDEEEGEGDEDRTGSGDPGRGKGLSREQRTGLEMVKNIMLSLDEEEGLEEIYTFRLKSFKDFSPIQMFFLTSHWFLFSVNTFTSESDCI